MISRNWAVGSVVAIAAVIYAQATFFSRPNAWQIVLGMNERPYVYRALVPWLARILTWLGLGPDQALSLLVVLAALGLWLAMGQGLRAGAGVVAFMALFFIQAKPYDLAAALFVAAGLAAIGRQELSSYFALFAFACANRETAVLLTLVFVVYYFGQMGWKLYALSVGYQGLLWAAVRTCLVIIYAGSPGVDGLVRPVENLQVFVRHPGWSLVHWSVVGALIWLCVSRQQAAGRLHRTAFWVMGPALLALYLVMGVAFEVRVFAEIWPVVWVMAASVVGNMSLCGVLCRHRQVKN